MKLPRRRFLHLAAGAAALAVAPHIARAQAYPSRPVRIVVPGAAGNTIDILARLMGQWLSEHLGQPFMAFGFEHIPVIGSQVPAAWHWSSAVQVTGLDPTHMPATQESV